MDELDGVPCEVLGYHITTRTQICLTCCVSVVLELFVYLVLTVADIAVIVQHYRDENPLFAGLTLLWVWLPAVVCFGSIMTSPWHWPKNSSGNRSTDTDVRSDDNTLALAGEIHHQDGCYCGKAECEFVLRQLFNMLAFPVTAIYHYSRRIFWSIEAMFHERDTVERAHAVAKAAETSPFELYHFLQAFLQAAPQTILQFYILLRENIFRNYETTHVQVISIVTSLITMAIISGNFQRFESQKVVGRNYPWLSRRQQQVRRKWFSRTKQSLIDERASKPVSTYTELPESDYIMRRFEARNCAEPSTSRAGLVADSINDLGADGGGGARSVSYVKSMHLGEFNINNINSDYSSESDGEIDHLRYKNNHMKRLYSVESNTDTVDMDYTPRLPPPPPPTIHIPGVDYVFERMSVLKDMMLLKTEMYIRDNVPRLPENFHLVSDENHKTENRTTKPEPKTHETTGSSADVEWDDEPDIVMPTRRKMIEGIEQDDFVGKSVSFMAWSCFLMQRMLVLSAFAYFHPKACLILCASHYLLMFACLLLETRFHEKVERIHFYMFLAYVYVFCILEFKIKFRKPRRVLVTYVVLLLVQNVSISVWWFGRREYGEATSISSAWWFGFMFAGVMLSGTYALMCWVVYYYLLRPKEKVLFEKETGMGDIPE